MFIRIVMLSILKNSKNESVELKAEMFTTQEILEEERRWCPICRRLSFVYSWEQLSLLLSRRRGSKPKKCSCFLLLCRRNEIRLDCLVSTLPPFLPLLLSVHQVLLSPMHYTCNMLFLSIFSGKKFPWDLKQGGQIENKATFSFPLPLSKCTICKVLESDQWNW